MNIGCDVHKDFHIFCDMDEKGEIIGEGRIENNTLAIDKFAREHKGSKVAHGGKQSLYTSLQTAG